MGVCSMLNNISWEKDTAALVTVSFLIIHRYLACALNASDVNIDIRGGGGCVVYFVGVIL